MPIVPDDKNWTWVLERVCPDCGFDATTFDPLKVRGTIEANALRWRELLADPRATRRPDDNTWSATEYACHVRDVYRLYLLRLERMLYEDGHTFANWDQDDNAIKQSYDQQQPQDAAGELHAAAGMLAARYATVGGAQWQRTGTRSDGVEFTIDSFTRYFIHDLVHHVWDAEQGYLRLGPVPWAPPSGEPVT
ncbi:MAG: DinB family protein [Ilumatobacteraceae bacterium]|nr:DinB family protein [Ilumatobacteraceae bacterium]